MLTHHLLQYLTKLEHKNNPEKFHTNQQDYEQTKIKFGAFFQTIFQK